MRLQCPVLVPSGGVNFKVTDAFATRISYLTEYNESRAIRTYSKLGLSLIYSF
jgi:putative salt-induced outer membrane protein